MTALAINSLSEKVRLEGARRLPHHPRNIGQRALVIVYERLPRDSEDFAERVDAVGLAGLEHRAAAKLAMFVDLFERHPRRHADNGALAEVGHGHAARHLPQRRRRGGVALADHPANAITQSEGEVRGCVKPDHAAGRPLERSSRLCLFRWREGSRAPAPPCSARHRGARVRSGDSWDLRGHKSRRPSRGCALPESSSRVRTVTMRLAGSVRSRKAWNASARASAALASRSMRLLAQVVSSPAVVAMVRISAFTAARAPELALVVI
jgi:hypothetical protein